LELRRAPMRCGLRDRSMAHNAGLGGKYLVRDVEKPMTVRRSTNASFRVGRNKRKKTMNTLIMMNHRADGMSPFMS